MFTYLIPLTNMRMRAFLVLSTVGRIPGVIISTYAAAGLAEGDITTSLIIFGIAAVLMILGIIFRDRIACVCLVPSVRFIRWIRNAKKSR